MIALTIRRNTGIVFILFWAIFSSTIHFIRNPSNGGIPASLAINTRVVSFLIVFRFFSVRFSWFLFQNTIKAVALTTEYIKKKIRYIFILKIMEIIIHLRLKREERPKISFTCVLFNMRTAPRSAERGTAITNMWELWKKLTNRLGLTFAR